jgi:hypothetical protein
MNEKNNAMTNQEDLPNVSMSNTKKELLDAYEEARKQLQARGKAVLDAEKVRTSRTVQSPPLNANMFLSRSNLRVQAKRKSKGL